LLRRASLRLRLPAARLLRLGLLRSGLLRLSLLTSGSLWPRWLTWRRLPGSLRPHRLTAAGLDAARLARP
jgi:hypothetical protein